MIAIRKLTLVLLFILSANIFAGNEGGDDAGNGGFAYKQSIKILQLATYALERKILYSELNDISKYPERRSILQKSLKYENLQKLYFWNTYRNGKRLAMDYDVKKQRVTILQAYYQAFAGKTDTELEDASLEVQKRLLHEASHIWGFNEEAAEKFSKAFLAEADGGSVRPTNAITFKSDFCSCLNGKSDIINSCDYFCKNQPLSSVPVLYVTTLLGSEITTHPAIGNLFNWCNKQLANDETSPQCLLNAYDGTNEINMPVSIRPGSNSFTANIQNLSKDRTWIMKLVEVKTGTNAQSKEAQIRRISPTPPDQAGPLKIIPANQYTCLHYGANIDSQGEIQRTTFVRQFYYFASHSTPPPLPPAPYKQESLTVCHDEQTYPGNDSAMYPRFELLPGAFHIWDSSDPRFSANSSNGKMKINTIIEERLLNEYNINATVNLFSWFKSSNRPGNNSANFLGNILLPFTNSETGKTYCPGEEDFNGTNPLMNLLGDYMSGTEGLYISEKEAEVVLDAGAYKTYYGTAFIDESNLSAVGFYIENGLKIKANRNAFHTKTIYYYGPINFSLDPLTQGNRKLFTIRTFDTLNGNYPFNLGTERTSDKRIGCIPKR